LIAGSVQVHAREQVRERHESEPIRGRIPDNSFSQNSINYRTRHSLKSRIGELLQAISEQSSFKLGVSGR
jgi:hypothetical protein